MSSQLIKDVIAGAIRHALQGVIVFLVAHGWVTENQGGELLIAVGVVGVMVIWSVVNKYGLYTKITTALGMEAESKRDIASGAALDKLDAKVEEAKS
jgi:hypothetical protein